MRPGITVQHVNLPPRRTGLVRCDIAGIIGFIPPSRWPEAVSVGDFVEVGLSRSEELWEHPLRHLFSGPTRRAVADFFENGGLSCHVFGLCIRGLPDLAGATEVQGAFASLFQRLRTEEDIAILLVPDSAYMNWSADRLGRVICDGDSLWETLLGHCREMGNRFLILDTPRGLHEDPLFSWIDAFTVANQATRPFGAIYYPWLRKGDDVYPPSGAMAGVYARTEREHDVFGVVWPPANVQVRGATHTDVDLDWSITGQMSDHAINPLVIQAGRGVVVWGARTLSRDPNWQFINSRRIVSMVAEQLRRDNEWAVFEQNDERLWQILERDVAVRLEEFWRAGLLTGETRHGDYEVQCNAETNPLIERDAGKLNVRVRIRPVGTTEHITIDLRLGEATT